jgi:broad specificity phosphatase PhoE
MAKSLYLMRHGQTVFNTTHRVQGWVDSPLTDLGIQQARSAGRLMRQKGLSFDHFLSSTSERASDTLETIMLELYGEVLPYERLKGLKESYFGTYEFAPARLLDPSIADDEDYFVPFGAEPYAVVRERMTETLADIMSRDGYESVLAVSHRRSSRAFLQGVIGGDVPEADLPNCGVARLDFDEAGNFTFVGQVLTVEGATL